MSNLTRRQHYVPRVYLGRWAPDKTNLLVLDKELGQLKSISVGDLMVQSWYYENTDEASNNELEKAFQDFEGPFARTLKLFEFVLGNTGALEQDPVQTVASMFTALPTRRAELASFAATLYFRTPGALETKRREVVAAGGPLPGLGAAVDNVYQFTKGGFHSSIIERLLAMRLCLVRSESAFITSDRPCFDIDRMFSRVPGLGDEIGIDDDVVCLMPLTPAWLAMFIPTLGGDNNEVHAMQILKQQTDAFNQLVRNKALRWVVEI